MASNSSHVREVDCFLFFFKLQRIDFQDECCRPRILLNFYAAFSLKQWGWMARHKTGSKESKRSLILHSNIAFMFTFMRTYAKYGNIHAYLLYCTCIRVHAICNICLCAVQYSRSGVGGGGCKWKDRIPAGGGDQAGFDTPFSLL
jgi:hypothetical protein